MPVILVVLAGLVCGSCSKKGEPLYPVRGKVLFKGKPVAEALVILHSLDDPNPDAVKPRAVTGPDGSFEVFTNEAGDGAPAGKYAVTIVGKTKPPTGAPAMSKPPKIPSKPRKSSSKPKKTPSKPQKKKPKVKPPLLPARYQDPKTSKLQVAVQQGPNELPPFDLKD